MGAGLGLPVPTTYIGTGSVAGVKASCACTNGSCKVQKTTGGGFKCIGNCPGICSLTIKGFGNDSYDFISYIS